MKTIAKKSKITIKIRNFTPSKTEIIRFFIEISITLISNNFSKLKIYPNRPSTIISLMDNQNRSRNEIPNRSRIDPRADPNRSRMDQQNRSRMVDQNRSRAFYDNRYPTPPPPPPTNYGYDKTPPPYSRNVSYYGMAAPDPNLNQIANASFYERKDASFYERKDASFNEKKDEGNASFYERKVVAPMSGREEDFNGKKGRIPRRFDEKEEKNENKM